MVIENDLEIQIEEIYSILNEIKKIQNNEFKLIKKNQNIIIKKLDKLQEYNEIDDMINSIVDRRLISIEQKLK